MDLAGSERFSSANNIESTAVFKQGVAINQSLLALRQVIALLAKRKVPTASHSNEQPNGHVPFRNSVLTRLLQHSLGGSCVTLMVACISPTASAIQVGEC